jgi:hypothetical protein
MQLYTQSQIGSKVARIVRVAGKVDSELHVVLCSILDHTREHGDYTAILPLLNGLPKGQRVKAIAAWLKHFSGKKLIARIDSESKQWVCELSKDRQESDFDIVGAMAITFGDFTAEKDPTVFGVDDVLKFLERKATDFDTNKDGSPKVSEAARNFASKLVMVARELKTAA